jgi:pyruvate dehydrogenase complex dehydrogenase (E1) component
MRIGTIVAKTVKGAWLTLATPDVSLQEQKLFLKQLKAEEGAGVLVGNERVDLTEAYLFESGDARHMKFKQREPKKPIGFAQNLKQLAEALEVPKEELDVLRKLEGFPERVKEGYDIEAVKGFIAELTPPAGADDEEKDDDENKKEGETNA